MRKYLPLAVLLAAVLSVDGASAQGVSTRAAGMAGALTAVPTGMDAMRFNPGALAFLPGFHLGAGAELMAANDQAMAFDQFGQRLFTAGPDALRFAPYAAMAARFWGASGSCSVRIADGVGTREWSALAAAGIALGPFGIGANVRWTRNDSLGAVDLAASFPSMDYWKSLASCVALPGVETGSRLEAGLGALLRVWELSLGAYVPDVLFVFRGGSLSSLLEEARAGVSFFPIHYITSSGFDMLSLLVAADIRNLGAADRLLCLGAEFKLDIILLGVTARAGYIMGMPGSPSSVPDVVTCGFTAHFMFLDVEAGVEMPGAVLTALEAGNTSALPLRKLFVTARLAF